MYPGLSEMSPHILKELSCESVFRFDTSQFQNIESRRPTGQCASPGSSDGRECFAVPGLFIPQQTRPRSSCLHRHQFAHYVCKLLQARQCASVLLHYGHRWGRRALQRDVHLLIRKYWRGILFTNKKPESHMGLNCFIKCLLGFSTRLWQRRTCKVKPGNISSVCTETTLQKKGQTLKGTHNYHMINHNQLFINPQWS